MPSRSHFISVSRRGALIARRVGEPPREIAAPGAGLLVDPTSARPDLGPLRVFFDHHRASAGRSVWVTAVEARGQRLDIAAFLDAHAVTEAELGAWMRAAVDAALDRAALDRP